MIKIATLILILISNLAAAGEWTFKKIEDDSSLKKVYWDGPIVDWHDWKTSNGAFNFKDFLIFKGTSYYTVKSRLLNNTGRYIDWVKITISLYSNETLVKSDYTYIDFETYGYAGNTPNSFVYFNKMMEIISFNKVGVNVEYDSKDGSDNKFEPNALKLQSSTFTKEFSLYEWKGSAKNASLTSLKFPKILAVFYKDGKILDFEYTYLDTPSDNSIASNSICSFNSYIDMPIGYDKVDYVLHYSLQLSGKVIVPDTAIAIKNNIPYDFKLYSNYPNPFNSNTTIQFELPGSTSIQLFVVNILGEKVDNIFTGIKEQGLHSIKWNAENISSGNYIIILQTGEIRKSILCTLVK